MGKVMNRWNEAWDDSTLTLAVYPFNKTYLEGKTEKDKDIIRRALFSGVIHNEKQYDALLKIVSDWGYCVETPADFNFSPTFPS